MLIPSDRESTIRLDPSLSRRVNANSQPMTMPDLFEHKLIKKGEC